METSTFSEQVSNKKKKRHSFDLASITEAHTTSPRHRHRRSWSISSNVSTTSANSTLLSQQDEVQRKLNKSIAMKSMFSSIRSVSLFSLIGDPSDDPDLPSQWEASGMSVSSTADSDKLNTNTIQRNSLALSQTSFSSVTCEKLEYADTSSLVHSLSASGATARTAGVMAFSQLTQKVRVQAATKDIDAMDVNLLYVPMPLPTIRSGMVSRDMLLISALCVYITPAKIEANGDPYTMHLSSAIDSFIYYAVYVPARTANALTMAIATKMVIDPASIVRTIIVNNCGLRLALDDELAREMLEKQDMRVAVREIECQTNHQDNTSAERQSGLELFLAY